MFFQQNKNVFYEMRRYRNKKIMRSRTIAVRKKQKDSRHLTAILQRLGVLSLAASAVYTNSSSTLSTFSAYPKAPGLRSSLNHSPAGIVGRDFDCQFD